MSNSQEQSKCEDCKHFYRQNYDDPEGQCRRYAPHPNTKYPDARTSWPEIGINAWCGEFFPKVEQLTDKVTSEDILQSPG